MGDVSSERAIVRSRSISCKLGDDDIDQKIAGHVSFMGKNGIKGEVVMRNGQILLYAGGSGFPTGSARALKSLIHCRRRRRNCQHERRRNRPCRIWRRSQFCGQNTLRLLHQTCRAVPPGYSDWCWQRSHAGFPDGFQLETLEEVRAKAAARKKQNQPSASSTPAAMPGNTPDMLKQLQDFRVGDTVDPTTGQVVTQ